MTAQQALTTVQNRGTIKADYDLFGVLLDVEQRIAQYVNQGWLCMNLDSMDLSTQEMYEVKKHFGELGFEFDKNVIHWMWYKN